MFSTFQMASPMYFLRNSVSWIAVLVPPSLLFAIFSGHGFLSLALLLITPMFLAFSKKSLKEEEEEEKVVAEEKAEQEEEEKEKHPQTENVDQFLSGHCDDDKSLSFSDEEDSDLDWPFSGNNSGHSPHYSSDCSISDEESLIELALPSGHFLGLEKQEQPLDFFLADINEEDNMIEIDISMGSIKCSRFEIIEA